MARTSDEPDFGEVKGLLRRLETTMQAAGPGAPSQGFPPYGGDQPRPPRAQQGLSPAAALFLVANTVMTTATVTSIAWYLFHAAEMQRNGRTGAGPAGAPAGAFQWPPRDYAAPTAGPTVAPESTAAVAARLVGPETFEVAPGQTIRVPLQLVPREAVADTDHVSIRGLPSNVTLNRGSQSAPDAWTVPIGALPELELFAAAAAALGRSDLVVTARSRSGRELASSRPALVVSTGSIVVTTPTATTPTAATTTGPATQPHAALDEATQAKHIAKAREFLGIGQVGAARLMLQRVADAGNAEAALILGDTYDPVRLFQLGARGLVGDTEKATFWYERADELGSPEAKARIIGLGRK